MRFSGIIPRTHRASCGGRLDPDRNVGRRIANLRTAYDEADRGERISRRRPAPIVGAPRSVDGAVYDVRGTQGRASSWRWDSRVKGGRRRPAGSSRGVASGRSSGRACRGRRSRAWTPVDVAARRLCGQHGDGRASLDPRVARRTIPVRRSRSTWHRRMRRPGDTTRRRGRDGRSRSRRRSAVDRATRPSRISIDPRRRSTLTALRPPFPPGSSPAFSPDSRRVPTVWRTPERGFRGPHHARRRGA